MFTYKFLVVEDNEEGYFREKHLGRTVQDKSFVAAPCNRAGSFLISLVDNNCSPTETAFL